jgi:hypothetical protein
LFSEPLFYERRFFGLSTARLGEELGSLLVVVGDGGEVGGALGVKLVAALLLPLELAKDSTLKNPLGEDTVGAAEDARLESDSTLWVAAGVAVRLLLTIVDGVELGLKLTLGVMLAYGLIVVLGAILLALGETLTLGTADVEENVGIALGAVLALGIMLSLATVHVGVKVGIALSALLGLWVGATLEEASSALLGLRVGDRLGAPLRLPLGLVIDFDSILGNPLGEATVGVAEGAL